jgi:hypothetical protein
VRRVLLGLAITFVGASLVGSAFAADRFERHAVPGQRMSLAVPAPWVTVDATLPAATIDRLGRENPKLAPFLGQISGPGSAAKFLALDPAVKGGFATNVNVVAVPVPSVTFARFRQAIVAEVQSIAGSATVDHRAVTIRGVRAVRLAYRFRITVGRTYTVSTLQYAFLRPGRSVVVTYTTLPGSAATYAPTFARSAASIRFT